MLNHRADINGPLHEWGSYSKAQSALYTAAAVHDKDLVRLYLDRGADVDAADVSEALDLATATFSLRTDYDVPIANEITTMIIDAIFAVKGRDNVIFEEYFLVVISIHFCFCVAVLCFTRREQRALERQTGLVSTCPGSKVTAISISTAIILPFSCPSSQTQN